MAADELDTNDVIEIGEDLDIDVVVDADGTVLGAVVDDLVVATSAEGSIVDETIDILDAEGDLLMEDEKVSVYDADGNLVAQDETVILPLEG